MIDENREDIHVERLDDIPLLLAFLYQMGIATLLDKQYPTHGNWAGELSFGTVACVWLSYILSEGDHRLCHLQEWVWQHQAMLEACLSQPVRPLDFHDDRLAAMLDVLCHGESFSAFEQDLNSNLLRVYRLEPQTARIDTTSSKTYAGVCDGGLFHYGYSSDRRPDLAQIKLSLASLDPIGLPLATAVVRGNTADEPLYLPAISSVQQSIGRGGKTYIGDSKMDALTTRAYLAATADYYLCPLSKKQVGVPELEQLICAAVRGDEELTEVFAEKQSRGQKRALIARGYRYEVKLEAAVDGQQVSWTEQRVVVRSEGFARQQAQVLDKTIGRACTALMKLNERRRGKKRLREAELQAAVKAILCTEDVESLVRVRVETARSQRLMRKCKERVSQVVIEEESQVLIEVDEEAVKEKKRRLGWRVYGTNHASTDWSLERVVTSYREQYLIERGFGRLKGKSLSLQPHYLHSAERVAGLLHLLVIGLRLLSLMESQARKSLAAQEEESQRQVRGIYVGQRQKSTSRPTTEIMLQAFRGVNLLQQKVSGEIRSWVTPLTELQKRILQLLDLPTDIYEGLSSHFFKPNLFLSET